MNPDEKKAALAEFLTKGGQIQKLPTLTPEQARERRRREDAAERAAEREFELGTQDSLFGDW